MKLPISSSGVVQELVVSDKMPLAWSAAGSLLFANFEQLFSATPVRMKREGGRVENKE